MRLLASAVRAPFGGLTLLLALAACCPAAAPKVLEVAAPKPAEEGPPVARMVDVVDHQFGVDVADPYRWMEGNDNAEYKTWLTAQGEYAQKRLSKLPGRDALFARLRELGLGASTISGVQIHNGRTIYRTLPAGAQLAKLATLDGTKERILIDPEGLGVGGKHASLNAYSLSPDGTYVGYVIALGGGEQGQLHVMDIANGTEASDVIDHIWGEFAPSWLPDSKSFFYIQMTPSDDPMQNMISRYHSLETSIAHDVTVVGRDADTTFPMAPNEFPGVWIDPSSPWVVIQAGGAQTEQHVAIAKRSELDLSGRGRTPWKLVANFADGVEGVMPHGDRLYVSTFKDAPNRKLISVPLAAPDLTKARIEVAEDPNANLDDWSVARDGVYLRYDVGGLAKLARWTWSGAPVPVPVPDGWITRSIADTRVDGLVYELATWLRPSTYFSTDGQPIGLGSTSKFVDARVVATEVEVPSRSVPLTILHFKDAVLDGSHPTIISGYAAYGSSQHASFVAARLAWLERGGVIAVCHARGGGEKGRAWQDAGSREHKLEGIRDVIACGEYLVAQKYTSRTRLGIEGGSMGGILMGRALDERPDLFAAAHIAVGAVNPLRILAAENGANQLLELGDPRTEVGYRSILAYDPYLDVKPKTAYPGVIFTVGLNDHRIAPWMTGKMAARLQALSTSGRAVLVRVEADAGHGIGSTRDQTFAATADVYAFMLQQFGVLLADR